MECINCGVDCTDEHEKISDDRVYCVECWERLIDTYERLREAHYYRER